MAALLALVALLASGVAAGVLLWSAVCGVPLLRRLDPARYVEVELFWGNRFEPFQPICVLLTVVCDVVLACTAAPAALFAVGAAAAAAVVVVSASRNVPMKRWVMSLDPQRLPEDFADRDPRAAWERWNIVRTSLALLAFVSTAVAVSF